MPAKVMGANPGLRDVSHSITGGSISAQGMHPFRKEMDLLADQHRILGTF